MESLRFELARSPGIFRRSPWMCAQRVSAADWFCHCAWGFTLRMASSHSRDVALDLYYPALNGTLASLRHRHTLLTVATHEYVPLTRNLLCSVRRWSASAAVSMLVVGADSWVCGVLPADVECVEPSLPHLAPSAFEIYSLKLRLAARAVASGHNVLMVDGATLLFEDPFAHLAGANGSVLHLSFQDKLCLDLEACPTRLATPPSPDHASTILFAAAAHSAAAALLDHAADLMREDASLFGDQEALRQAMQQQHWPSWAFLPYPAFVRSMAWHYPGGVAGHDDASLIPAAALAPPATVVGYAGGMTQRGLTARERVAVKMAALQRARLWLVGGEGKAAVREECDAAWRWTGSFTRDPARPDASADATGGADALVAFSIAPAALSVDTIRRLYMQAALLLQQPRREGTPEEADEWWQAALHVRALEATLSEHLDARAAEAARGEPTISSQWFQLFRATSPKELWEIAERAQQAASAPRTATERGVPGFRSAIRHSCRGWLSRLRGVTLAAADSAERKSALVAMLQTARFELRAVLLASGDEGADEQKLTDQALLDEVGKTIRWLNPPPYEGALDPAVRRPPRDEL